MTVVKESTPWRHAEATRDSTWSALVDDLAALDIWEYIDGKGVKVMPPVYERPYVYVCGGCGNYLLFERNTDWKHGIVLASCQACQRTVKVRLLKVEAVEV